MIAVLVVVCGAVAAWMLVDHLLSVGYTRVDVVEMPGQLTLRGGILDVYSPESDRPVRIDFFGDEIESIRRFDPDTQRSASTLDDALLLPLTEIPVTNRVLEAINARLTRSGMAGAQIEGGEEPAGDHESERHRVGGPQPHPCGERRGQPGDDPAGGGVAAEASTGQGQRSDKATQGRLG